MLFISPLLSLLHCCARTIRSDVERQMIISPDQIIASLHNFISFSFAKDFIEIESKSLFSLLLDIYLHICEIHFIQRLLAANASRS